MLIWRRLSRNRKPASLNPSSPYQVIAKGVKNDGSYHWKYPGTVSGDVFIRLEVTDKAGNVTQCNNVQPPDGH